MKRCTVFYGQQVHEESDDWIRASETPDGAYMRWQAAKGVVWYHRLCGGWTPINLSDLPSEMQLILLLMT